MNLLIIDPNDEYFETLKLLLTNMDIKITKLSEPKQAPAHPVDLIIVHESVMHAIIPLNSIGQTPYIVVSSDYSDDTVGALLNNGAEDVLALPIKPKESVARINAVLKRIKKHDTSRLLTFDNEYLKINLDTHEVHVSGSPIKLTSTEFQILETLATNPQRIFSRVDLMEGIRGLEFSGSDRAIASHVKNLRHKIEEDSKHPAIS